MSERTPHPRFTNHTTHLPTLNGRDRLASGGAPGLCSRHAVRRASTTGDGGMDRPETTSSHHRSCRAGKRTQMVPSLSADRRRDEHIATRPLERRPAEKCTACTQRERETRSSRRPTQSSWKAKEIVAEHVRYPSTGPSRWSPRVMVTEVLPARASNARVPCYISGMRRLHNPGEESLDHYKLYVLMDHSHVGK